MRVILCRTEGLVSGPAGGPTQRSSRGGGGLQPARAPPPEGPPSHGRDELGPGWRGRRRTTPRGPQGLRTSKKPPPSPWQRRPRKDHPSRSTRPSRRHERPRWPGAGRRGSIPRSARAAHIARPSRRAGGRVLGGESTQPTGPGDRSWCRGVARGVLLERGCWGRLAGRGGEGVAASGPAESPDPSEGESRRRGPQGPT